MGRNSVLETFQDNIKLLFLILVLPCLCRGVSPGKTSEHSVPRRLSTCEDGWQTPRLGSADGLSALPRQMVNLGGLAVAVVLCF